MPCRKRPQKRREQAFPIRNREDVLGILSLHVLSDFDLQQEGFEYIEKRPEIQIMDDYVKARFDYLLDKFPDVKAAYHKVAGSESQKQKSER